MAISIGLMTILLSLQQHFLLRLETKLALTTSAKFFMHVIQLPMEFFSQRFAGEIGSRVLINDKVAKVLSEKLATTLLDMMSLVFFGLILLRYDVLLTITCVDFFDDQHHRHQDSFSDREQMPVSVSFRKKGNLSAPP